MRVTLVPNFQLEYSIQLANALAERAEVSFPCWDGLSSQLLSILDPRVEIIALGAPGRYPWHRLWNEVQVSRILTNEGCDVVHFQNAYVWRTPFVTRLRSPCVLTVHDPFPHTGIPDPWSFPALCVFAASADAVVVHGRAQRELLMSRFELDVDKVHVIPHGEFSFYRRFASVPEGDRRTFLFLGRITRYKGLEHFLGSIPLVKQRVKGAHFRIVGEGDLAPYAKRINSIEGLEIVNRFISPAEMAQEIGRAAAVVLPYIEASQSGVAITAQSLGRPVIVTDVGGLAEDVLDMETGVVVRRAEFARIADGIAEAVVFLADNPSTRIAMGRKAQEWMETTRSWTRIAQQTVELYEALL